MYKVTYEVVTRDGKRTNVRYFTNTTKKMTSRILPSLLRFFFAMHPHESLVYAKLYQFVEE